MHTLAALRSGVKCQPLRYVSKVNSPVETDKLQSVCSSVISGDTLMTQLLVLRAQRNWLIFLKQNKWAICCLRPKLFTQSHGNKELMEELDLCLKLKISWVKGKKHELKYMWSRIQYQQISHIYWICHHRRVDKWYKIEQSNRFFN